MKANRQAAILELLHKVKRANEAKDRNAGKNYRRQVRLLGHKGALRGTTPEKAAGF